MVGVELAPKGPNHLPVLPLLPAHGLQQLGPTCPTGVSGLGPARPSAQLNYGKEGCKQRTGGRSRTKGLQGFVCSSSSSKLPTSHCRGAGIQGLGTYPPRGSRVRSCPHCPSKAPPFQLPTDPPAPWYWPQAQPNLLSLQQGLEGTAQAPGYWPASATGLLRDERALICFIFPL